MSITNRCFYNKNVIYNDCPLGTWSCVSVFNYFLIEQRSLKQGCRVAKVCFRSFLFLFQELISSETLKLINFIGGLKCRFYRRVVIGNYEAGRFYFSRVYIKIYKLAMVDGWNLLFNEPSHNEFILFILFAVEDIFIVLYFFNTGVIFFFLVITLFGYS